MAACISLLKILLTNSCIYDCAYCINRRSSNVQRARFTVAEVVQLTLGFYRRNCIEGLFLSSGIISTPDYTMEQVVEVARTLREDHGFRGYIHLKTIPDAAPELLAEAGRYADRLSINVELPTQDSLVHLAPEKDLPRIRQAMGRMRLRIDAARDKTASGTKAPRFAPAGQSTQVIVGADSSSDRDILGMSTNLYGNYGLRRVYYSAFSPIPDASAILPPTKAPLLREHRLYQADWLMRFYGFEAGELTTDSSGNMDLSMDPKLAWALAHREQFPVDVNTGSRGDAAARARPGREVGRPAVAGPPPPPPADGRRGTLARADDQGRPLRHRRRPPARRPAGQRPLVPAPGTETQADGDVRCVASSWRTRWTGAAGAAPPGPLALDNIPPDDVAWSVGTPDDLFAADAPEAPATTPAGSFTVPRALVTLAETAIQAREPARFALLYRLLWRAHGGEKHLMEQTTDPELQRAQRPGAGRAAGCPQDARLRPLPRRGGNGGHALRQLVRAGALHRGSQCRLLHAPLRHHGLVDPDALSQRPLGRHGRALRPRRQPARRARRRRVWNATGALISAASSTRRA